MDKPIPTSSASLAKGRMRTKRDLLEQALAGSLQPHHRFLIQEHLTHIEHLDERIVQADAQIAERLRPYEAILKRLQRRAEVLSYMEASLLPFNRESEGSTFPLSAVDSIPGINRRTAEILLAELGLDIHRFPSADHLASWAGLCPGNKESAGKRLSGKTRKGSPWLRTALVEAANAAARSKNTYLAAKSHRLVARRGRQKALVALAHTLLVMAYYVLLREEEYQELGGSYFDERDRQAVQRRLVRRLENLGYQVVLQPAAPVA